jgi:hypothetical protein
MITYPNRQTKTLTQLNSGNFLGDLWSSFGIDLNSNLGAIRLGSKMKINTSSDSETNLGLPYAIANFDLRMFCLAGTKVFKNGQNNFTSSFTEDTLSAGVPTGLSVAYSDMIQFNGELVVSKSNKIYTKVANGSGTGAWTDRGVTLSAEGLHKMAYFKKFDKLYVVDNSTKIRSAEAGWSGGLTTDASPDGYLDIGSSLGIITTIASSSRAIWIATLHPSNIASGSDDSSMRASILEWDGQSSTISNEYKVDAHGVLALIVKNDVPYAIDSNGNILKFTGYSFQKINSFPIDKYLLNNATSTLGTDSRFIHPNGIDISKDGEILMLINNAMSDSSATVIEQIPSGIWAYSDTHGLYHKHPLSFLGITSSTLTDYGQNRLASVGALKVGNIQTTSSNGRSEILCGASYYKNATTTANGIFLASPFPYNSFVPEGKKVGYFVTQFINSEQVKDTWNKIVLKYKQLLSATDKITIKIRIRETDSTEMTANWINNTSFTTSTDLSAYSIGDEIEILSGLGSGKCAHITTLQEGDSNTYIVDIDSAVDGITTGTSKVRVQKWIKLSDVSNQTNESSIIPVGLSSERIQIKCYMEFTGDDELFELALINKNKELMV